MSEMRRSDREVTDPAEIRKIVDEAKILHLGLFDGEYPYVVPMHYGYRAEEGRLIFYTHGAKEGHKLDLIAANPKVCVELDCGVEPISGGEIACRYGTTYASVIGRGMAEVVTDTEEKILALKLLMEHQTGRRFEIDARMADAVGILRIRVETFTAKTRTN